MQREQERAEQNELPERRGRVHKLTICRRLSLPNGSRLSCGASAGRRKRRALRYEPVGAQTYASSESRPRQLQALVRQRHQTRQA